MPAPVTNALFWIDVETDGLPVGNDFSMVNVLEVAVIITDFDLNPLAGYTEVIKLTQASVDRIKANDYVKEMHLNSGLLRASKEATHTLAEVEQEIITLMKKTTFDKKEFMIAGSGVAAFDHPLIKSLMPQLDQWLAYFPMDIGIARRTNKILAGRDLVNPTPKSYQEGVKTHRALDDVQAHIEEAKKYQEFFRGLQ